MKKSIAIIAAASMAVVAFAADRAVNLNVDAARLWSRAVSCPGTNEVAFAAPARGHAVVLEVYGTGVTDVTFAPRGGAAPVAVGTVTNGLLSAVSPVGIPPLHAGDRLVLRGRSVAATNDLLVVYSEERSLDGSSK